MHIEKKIQIICHHESPSETWEELCQRFPEAEIKWTAYAGASVAWPKENCLEFRAGFYLNWSPDLIYDLSYGLGDTLSPLHIYQLQRGATLEIKGSLDSDRSVQFSYTTWYGKWNMYQ